MEVSTEVVSDQNGVTVCEEEMTVRIPAELLGGNSSDHVMKLALLHDERDIEPIFSGAAWAGSVLWAAAQGHIEVFGQELQEAFLRQGCDGRVLQGHDTGRPGRPVDRRQVAEMTAGIDVVQGDFPPGQGIDDDPRSTRDDEEDVPRFALTVDDLFLSVVGLPRTGLFQPFEFLLIQVRQQMYLRQ